MNNHSVLDQKRSGTFVATVQQEYIFKYILRESKGFRRGINQEVHQLQVNAVSAEQTTD